MLSEKIFRPGQSRCSLILTEHHEEKRAHESIEQIRYNKLRKFK